jgi:hypothetical protein
MLLVALVHTPWAALGEALHAGSQAVGAPFRWPTDAEMSRMVVECGFRDVRQHRVFRIPAGMLLPPVLTEGMRPGAA